MLEQNQPSLQQRVAAEAAARRRRFVFMLVAAVATARVAIYLLEPRPAQQTAAATPCGPSVDAADCRCAIAAMVTAAAAQTRWVAVDDRSARSAVAPSAQVDPVAEAAAARARQEAFAQRLEACRLNRTSLANR